jgi:hypothetical protein
MSALLQDVRYALRSVRKSPGFAALAVLILGLGIGANAAIFTVVDVMLFRPSPWNSDGQMVWIISRSGSMSYQDYVAFRDHATSFSGVSAYSGGSVSIGGAEPRRVLGGVRYTTRLPELSP